MLARVRTGAKFFTIGLLLGLLFAPEAGSQLRERLFARLVAIVPGPLRGE